MHPIISICLVALSKLPFERIFIKPPDPTESVKKLEAAFASHQPLSKPTIQAEKTEPLKEGSEVLPDRPGAETRAENKELLSGRRVTTEETIAYQKRELGKEILLLEKHLQQKCKIGGIACDCCQKHPIAIEALAQESLGMSNEPIFNDITVWIRGIAPMTTEAASKSGKFDDLYPRMAIKARDMRKNLMGTDEVKALLDEAQTEKVASQVEEILGRSINKQGAQINE